MILLITKYNLTPKWIQLLTFFIFYLLCIKLHYIDNDVVDCMRRINNGQTSPKIEGAPIGAPWLSEADDIIRPIRIRDIEDNAELHRLLNDRADYVRINLGKCQLNPSENKAITGLVQGLELLDILNNNHNRQLDNLEAGFGNIETNLHNLNERLDDIDKRLTNLNNQLNPSVPVPVPAPPVSWEQLIGQCVVGAGKGACKLATNPETYKTAGIITALVLSVVNISL